MYCTTLHRYLKLISYQQVIPSRILGTPEPVSKNHSPYISLHSISPKSCHYEFRMRLPGLCWVLPVVYFSSSVQGLSIHTESYPQLTSLSCRPPPYADQIGNTAAHLPLRHRDLASQVATIQASLDYIICSIGNQLLGAFAVNGE